MISETERINGCAKNSRAVNGGDGTPCDKSHTQTPPFANGRENRPARVENTRAKRKSGNGGFDREIKTSQLVERELQNAHHFLRRHAGENLFEKTAELNEAFAENRKKQKKQEQHGVFEKAVQLALLYIQIQYIRPLHSFLPVRIYFSIQIPLVQTDTHGKYKKRLVLQAKNKTPLTFHCCVTYYSIKNGFDAADRRILTEKNKAQLSIFEI